MGGGRGRTRSHKKHGEERKKEMEDDAQSSEDGAAEAMRPVLREIREFRAEHKRDLNKLKEDVTTELKDLKKEIYEKLSANSARMDAHENRLKEAEARINEVETINMAIREVLVKSTKEQKIMQEKLADMEGRSRRNNLCIYGIPEEKEGDSMLEYVDQFLKSELGFAPEVNLQLQRAHRALARKPERNAPPRSIIVNFLEFTTKEMILKKAWDKDVKILVDGRRILFDHDYATAVIQKRKEYVGIKRVLKENGIRFQTPLDKIRIHWTSGVRTYSNAYDAAQELRKKGYNVEIPSGSTLGQDAEMEHLRQSLGWQRAGEKERGEEGKAAHRARARLQEFERSIPK